MSCSKCNYANPGDALFCMKCGTRLERPCASCGVTNPGEANFCRKCGAALGALSRIKEGVNGEVLASSHGPGRIRETFEEPEGERKTVTALFADIKGSTELMRDLDPEEARAIIDPALKIMVEAVQRYDGYVVQSTGDGIFALFGAPVAHEDHPQRALYAALRMHEATRGYGDRLRAEGIAPLQIRVGANTGEVVVRTITTGDGKKEYTPIGHTANLAARLQALANPGATTIAGATRALVEGYFTLKSLGESRVKGVSEAIAVYEVTGLGPLRTRLQRAVGRGLTKFVGREREMIALRDAAEQAQRGRGQIVAAIAEAGIGKSRLFYEFKTIVQSGWKVLETLSISHGKASPYLPVIDLLRDYFEISATDDERRRREKVAGRITILDRALEDTLPFLFALLGIVEGDDPIAEMDGQTKKQRTLEAIKRILQRESLNQPLLIIFEDLHWIDRESASLLNLIADSIATANILLLVNYRPEYSHEWSSKSYYTQLRLDPLASGSASEMLNSLLGSDPELDDLKRAIIEKTEGNPFFIEEIVQNLIEEGALHRSSGPTRFSRSLSSLQIPTTVQAVLTSRIDRLPAYQKEMLQTLAVLGKKFSLSHVKAVTSQNSLETTLAALQLAEFIYEQPAVGDVEYTFKHALTQEVAYNSILSERRKALHEHAGNALEVLFATTLADHYGDLAHHYRSSGNTAKAVQYLQAAAQQATNRSAYGEALALADSGLALLEKLADSEARERHEFALQMTIGLCSFVSEGWAAKRSGNAYRRAFELGQRIGEETLAADALLGLQQFYLGRGDLRKTGELDQELLEFARKSGNETLLYNATYLAGLTLCHTGQFGAAREKHERVAASRPQKISGGLLEHPWVCCMAYLSAELWHLGYPDAALAASEEGLRRARAENHPFSLALSMMFAAILRILRREAEVATVLANDLIAIAGDHNLGSFRVYATMFQGHALSMRGDARNGIELMRKAGENWQSMSAMSGALAVPSATLAAAQANARLGKTETAIAMVDTAIEQIQSNGEFLSESDAYRIKGEMLTEQEAFEAAEHWLSRALQVARTQQAKSLELRAAMSLARLRIKQGRRDEARDPLAEIYGWFTEGFDTADLKDAKALLDELNL
jgi:class 3 adenylate cyclase/tetratricopeptide (TPR) repeat protein/ribosomal protein L40E